MIAITKTIRLTLCCLVVALSKPTRSAADVHEHVIGHGDYNQGINPPGTCCRQQGKGFDLWSGYCFEKHPAYARPTLLPISLLKHGRCQKCQSCSSDTPCAERRRCCNTADVRQPNSTPSPAASPTSANLAFVIPAHSTDSDQQVEDDLEIADQIDTLLETSITIRTRDEEINKQAKSALGAEVSVSDQPDRVNAVSVSLRDRLYQQQIRATRKAQTGKSNERRVKFATRSESESMPIALAAHSEPETPQQEVELLYEVPVSDHVVITSPVRSSKLASNYRDLVTERLRKNSKNATAAQDSE